jgi:hypothetical protein
VSIERATLVFCDGDGCDAVYPPDTFSPGTAKQHRADLRRDGWKTNLPGGRDLCSDCLTEQDNTDCPGGGS